MNLYEVPYINQPVALLICSFTSCTESSVGKEALDSTGYTCSCNWEIFFPEISEVTGPYLQLVGVHLVKTRVVPRTF